MRTIITLILISLSCHAFAQDKWEKLCKEKPQTALIEARKLYDRAEKDGDSPAKLQAILLQIRCQTAIDSDSLPSWIIRTEDILQHSGKPVEQCLLHSLLADLYMGYYSHDRYRINRRTATEDYTPSSMDEWPRDTFNARVRNHALAALQPQEPAENTLSTDYKLILELGKDSRQLRPTLFDLLCHRSISQLQEAGQTADIATVYDKWIAFRKKDTNREALLIAEFEYAQYMHRALSNDSLYMGNLHQLIDNHADLPPVVEVVAELAQIEYDRRTPENADSVCPAVISLCERYIHRFPSYPRINRLKELIQEVKSPTLSIRYDECPYPHKPIIIKISHTYISDLRLRIFRLNGPTENCLNDKDSTAVTRQLVRNHSFSLPLRFASHDTTITIPGLESGYYTIAMQGGKGKENRGTLICTPFLTTTQNLGKTIHFVARDRLSGLPSQNARIRILKYSTSNWSGKLIPITTILTDSNGMAQYTTSLNTIHYETINDHNPNGQMTRVFPYFAPTYRSYPRIDLFTDRAVYRPGQTLMFYGIAHECAPDSNYVLPDKSVKVILTDSNGKNTGSFEAITNEWGSFSGSFTLPRETLNGNFRLAANNTGFASITVAEYKRPQVEISLDPQKTAYSFGDEITLTGTVRTYSGIRLQNIPVHFEISLRAFFRHNPSSNESIIGETSTNAEGEFIVRFQAQKPSDHGSWMNAYHYIVRLTATDTKGENTEITRHIPIRDERYNLSISGETYINKGQTCQFRISARNAANEEIDRTVHYGIAKLAPTRTLTDYPDTGESRVGQSVRHGVINTLTDTLTTDLSSLESGAYLLSAYEILSDADSISAQKVFYLYADEETRPPYPLYLWAPTQKIILKKGEPTMVRLGTAAKDVALLCQVLTEKGIGTQKNIRISDTIRSFTFPTDEQTANRFCIDFSFVKDDKLFTHRVYVAREEVDDQRLTLHTKVFRDKLVPGKEETWEITVQDAKGKAEIAEIAAAMYDISLDKFRSHSWNLYNNTRFEPQFPTWNWRQNRTSSSWLHFPRQTFKYPSLSFDRLRFIDFYLYNATLQNLNLRINHKMLSRASGIVTDDAAFDTAESAPMTPREGDKNGEENDFSDMSILRTDFAETAFFFPHVISNEKGIVTLHFTVPESLTRWKFMAIAHTKNMVSGNLVQEVTTQKPINVMPNIPRFLRSGDRAVLKTLVANLTDSPAEGEATLELFSPIDDSVVLRMTNHFHADAGKNTTVTFAFDTPLHTDVIGCRIIAFTSDFSDGEQHLLPVLSDKVRLTEATPFFISTKGQHRIPLPTENTGEENLQLTVEATANPIWYAVEALPSLQEPTSDNATAITAAFYANTVAASIASSNPAIANAIKVWAAPTHTETRLSKLMQNETFKAILLDATPWVTDAQNETERIQTLTQLFNANRLHDLQSRALQKLHDLQNEDGGWGWFKGMPSNSFTSCRILSAMGKATLTADWQADETSRLMQAKALRYIDKRLTDDLLKGDTVLTYDHLHYLYARSFYRDIPLGDALHAHKTLMGKVVRQWPELSPYGKALAATVCQRYGKRQTALAITESLKEYATVRPDLGMFWANNRLDSRTVSAVIVHAALMDALHEVEGDTPDTDLMKQWLIRQKRTQNWGDIPATIDAIHALLLTGLNLLNHREHLTMSIGHLTLESSQEYDVLGVQKHTLTSLDITPDMNLLNVVKNEDTPTWGSVYTQYSTSIRDVRKNETRNPLQIDKHLFIAKNTAKGTSLRPIKGDLHVGDMVMVRLTLTADQDMEYVCVKECRPACFEPARQMSGTRWTDGLCLYEEIKDNGTNLFIQRLPKGTHIIEYPLYVDREGTYVDGGATAQCLYAAEFTSHSATTELNVKGKN